MEITLKYLKFIPFAVNVSLNVSIKRRESPNARSVQGNIGPRSFFSVQLEQARLIKSLPYGIRYLYLKQTMHNLKCQCISSFLIKITCSYLTNNKINWIFITFSIAVLF